MERRHPRRGLASYGAVAALLASLALPGNAIAAQAQPWTYVFGPVQVPNGSQFVLQMYNASPTAQTYSLPAQISFGYAGAPDIQVGGSGGESEAFSTCNAPGSCTLLPIISTSSSELFPTLTTAVADNTDVGTVVIGPGQFGLVGPNGTVNEAVGGAAATASTAFGSLEGSASSLQGLLGSTSSQVGGIASTLGGGSSSSGQVGALQRQVNTLTSDVTKLTALVKKLEPKPKPKPKKKKTKR